MSNISPPRCPRYRIRRRSYAAYPWRVHRLDDWGFWRFVGSAPTHAKAVAFMDEYVRADRPRVIKIVGDRITAEVLARLAGPADRSAP